MYAGGHNSVHNSHPPCRHGHSVRDPELAPGQLGRRPPSGLPGVQSLLCLHGRPSVHLTGQEHLHSCVCSRRATPDPSFRFQVTSFLFLSPGACWATTGTSLESLELVSIPPVATFLS